MIKVKTFTNELKIFHAMDELAGLDRQVNSFIEAEKIQRVISVSDCATADEQGRTIGLIRVLTYEDSRK